MRNHDGQYLWRFGLQSADVRGNSDVILVWMMATRKSVDVDRYVALLRAVNVGKANRIHMASLCKVMVDEGFTGAKSHLQSGNLVFGWEGSSQDIQATLEGLIFEHFRLAIAVTLRPAQEFSKLVSIPPFELQPAEEDNLYVTFLSKPIDAHEVGSHVARGARDNDYRIVGSEVFVHCRGPYHLSNLGNSFWERVSGGSATTRRWSTVVKLAALADG